MEACIFCEIADGRRPAPVVLRTGSVTAFLDHAPLFFGHTLLVPRVHVTTLEDLPTELVEPFFVAASQIARAVRIATRAQGTLVAMNNVVSQSVPHFHAHIVPRTKGDGLRGFFWPRTRYRDEDHREEVRVAIVAALGS